VGSYFALQWLANLLVTATSLGSNCVASETVYTVVYLISLLVSHGLSGIGTNLLCHRYLCEKARVMLEASLASAQFLEKLEASFVWEARSLCIVAVAVPLYVIYPPAAYIIGGLGTLVVVVMVRARLIVSPLVFYRALISKFAQCMD
jgi:hypothetical protein